MTIGAISLAINRLQRELESRNLHLSAIVIEGKYVRETLIGLARAEAALVGNDHSAPDDSFTIADVRILT